MYAYHVQRVADSCLGCNMSPCFESCSRYSWKTIYNITRCIVSGLHSYMKLCLTCLPQFRVGHSHNHLEPIPSPYATN